MSDDRTPTRGRLREHVAEEIRVLLARKRMSGAELGRRAGIKQSSISRRITGEVAFDMDDLEAVADVLGVAVTDLLPKVALTGGTPDSRTPVEPNRYSARLTGHPEIIPQQDVPRRPRLVGNPPFGQPRQDSRRPSTPTRLSTSRPRDGRPTGRPRAA